MNLTPTNKDLFFTKNDPQDPRLGEWALHETKPDPLFCLFGYPDDEGIRLNGGRPGASAAPDAIRSFFYKMTPDPREKKKFSINDLGNLNLAGSLAERHERGRELVLERLKLRQRWISLGGGHDYGYCDSAAFVSHYRQQKPVIINFDAHLDVRPTDKGLHSGTPFRRLLQEFHDQCYFIEVGLQPQCNSPSHVEWLEHHGGKILWHQNRQDSESQQSFLEALQKIVPLSTHPAFISVDIDCFANSTAPGCSQSWESGLTWQDFSSCFDFLIDAFDVQGLGIYEVSPALDIDNRTSKLAALIMHRFIFQTLLKAKE